VGSQLVSNHGLLYTGIVFLSVCLVAGLEALFPRRALSQPMRLRWASNIATTVINTFVVRAVFPLALVAVAAHAEDSGSGLFNVIDLPTPLSMIPALILLDLGTWALHYTMHRTPVLWRLHAVHHSDPDYDFSTGLRFHPVEAITTFGLQSLVILLLGPPALAVLVYKLVTAFMAAFAHGNLRLPVELDNRLRKVVVTPDVHRIHHSANARETNSNYAGVTPCWDRLFGTYIDQPASGHEELEVGLTGQRSVESVKLHAMLLQPFRI